MKRYLEMDRISKCIVFLLPIVCLAAAQNVSSGVRSENFFVPALQANWYEAVLFCHQQGMRIATLDSEAKQRELTDLIQSSAEVFNPEYTRVWIGGTDLAQQGQFRWLETGVDLRRGYINWARREPNNYLGNERCTEMRYRPAAKWIWNWNDQPCEDDRLLVACEVNRGCTK